MLIPSIDLQGGRIVQLVQGERLALATDDFTGWITRFASFAQVQLIDLDAAKNAGDNTALVVSICAQLPCRVGGGVRSVERALSLLESGAQKVIVGSAIFKDGRPDIAFSEQLAPDVGRDHWISAGAAPAGSPVVDGCAPSSPSRPKTPCARSNRLRVSSSSPTWTSKA
jgi:phosphoribosylformimino-5-aminoimidazole carboxamide ribotide isomerase